MPRITGLVANPRREGRYRLEVDGKAVATVDAQLVHDTQLRVGDEFDAPLAARVVRAAARLAAFDKALGALARRARSTRELERWLAEREHARHDIAAAIVKLTALGYLNDAEYARAFARSRAAGRGMGRRRIQAELARRGVAREVVDAALSDVLADEGIDERAQVEAAARKKLRSLAKLDRLTRRRRLYAFLSRRGYAPDLVRETVAQLNVSPD